LLGKTLALLAWLASPGEVFGMTNYAVYRDPVNRRLASIALLVSAAMLLVGLGPDASARPLVGKDGKIHACYRVKGKPRGALRAMPGARSHCRRGERKVAWTVAGAVGATGSSGSSGTQSAQGAQGSAGQAGSQGTVSSTLTEQIGSLSTRIANLEGTLAGIGHTDLTGMLDTLQGLDNEQLKDAVDVLPAVESLCAQSKQLAEQVNLLQGVVGGLGLEPALETIGLLEIPPLPAELKPEDFGCALS